MKPLFYSAHRMVPPTPRGHSDSVFSLETAGACPEVCLGDCKSSWGHREEVKSQDGPWVNLSLSSRLKYVDVHFG